ncbi:MAG: ATP-binding protein [Bacilli bacterium]|nr:ATP-binding protein [Bacilli bacterium]
MIGSFLFQICSLFYIVLLIYVFFSKRRIKLLENNIYAFLMIFDAVLLVVDIISVSFIYNMDQYPLLNIFFAKLFLVMLIVWLSTLSVYVFTISRNDKEKANKVGRRTTFLAVFVGLLSVLTIFILPLHFVATKDYVYSFGPSANFTYFFTATLIMVWIIRVLSRLKYVKRKKVTPIILYIIMALIGAAIQFNYPDLLVVSFVSTFITILMYFTIENPDVKTIQELNQNRRLIEKTNEDKSNFLFRMAQEVRQPIEDIIKVNNIMKQSKEPETIEKGIKYIEYSSKQLRSVVNNVLGISSIDSYNIKMMSSTYNVNSLFAEIYSKYKNQINEKIDFKFNINQSIPKILYGDSVKLKQIITTLLENAIKYTKDGFIALNVDAITKNDVCRLIISVEDTGCGMSIDKVNELLSLDQELTEEDTKILDKINLNLNIAAKIIKLLGGNILIKSDEGKGSEFILVIEQKVKKDETKINLEKHSKNLFKNKRILIVDDSKEKLEEITRRLKEHNVEIVTTMYGSDCVEKIKTNQKFDLILMDDDMIPDTGLATLQELQKIDKFKTPVIIMLEKNKEIIKEHYLEEGFKDYVLKFKLETEMKRIAEKYL